MIHFFLFQDILSQSTVALHIEVRPRYLIPDTNCFVDDLISIKAIASAHPLYQLMIPITGKFSTTTRSFAFVSMHDSSRCCKRFYFIFEAICCKLLPATLSQHHVVVVVFYHRDYSVCFDQTPCTIKRFNLTTMLLVCLSFKYLVGEDNLHKFTAQK